MSKKQLFLTYNQRREMQAQIQACLPEEACGLVGGVRNGNASAARVVLGVTNELHSPVRFRTATRDSIEFAGAYEDLKIMHAARSGTLSALRS